MTKIDIISGFLGAGKTTLIKKLIEEGFKGEKLVLIENEFGEIGIDGGFLKDAGVQITEMNSGCICCSLVGDFGTALKKVITEYAPDRIIIEPSGVGKLSDVIKAVKDVAEEVEVQLDSYTTVADVSKCKIYMKNFGEFFNNQIESANTIVLSRTQTASQDKIEKAVAMIREHNAEATIITTPWDDIDGSKIKEAMQNHKSVKDALFEDEDEHEHHHHDHGGHEHEHCHEHDHEGHGHGHEGHHHAHHHRSLADVTAIIDGSQLSDGAKRRALAIFSVLAAAEAKAHGKTPETVMFHEVGAVDSIVDVCSVAICLDDLGIEDIVVESLSEGHGTIRCAHGLMPIPVPAVVNLCQAGNIALTPAPVAGELVTPTGAAIVTALRTSDQLPSRYRIEAVGYGAGKRPYEGCSGTLRCLLVHVDA